MKLELLYTTETILQIAQVIPCTEAEGPGKRFAIWFQGCPLRCPGCCNPEMLPFHGGQPTPVEILLEQIAAARRDFDIEGITLIGGEPVAHARGAAILAREVRSRGLTVMMFSGYTIEDIQARPEPEIAELLAETDLLVDGPYVRELPESSRRWIGSSNQRIHFLTPAYRADDPRWQVANTLEIRFENGEILINGFPAGHAVDMWKRLGRKPSRKTEEHESA